MKDLRLLDRHRVPMTRHICELWGMSPFGGGFASDVGAFALRSPIEPKRLLRVLASNGEGWDHLSVSMVNRCPRWSEMEFIKRLFFLPEEVAMQLHVPPSDHISFHPYCLHIWRPHGAEIPLPPPELVGPRKEQAA